MEDGMMELLKSRKFMVTAITLIAMVLHGVSGIEIGAEQVETMAQLVCAYVVGQGIADAGAGGTTREG